MCQLLFLVKFTDEKELVKDAPTNQQTDGPTDRRTDGPTDRRTDTPSYRDARMDLKSFCKQSEGNPSGKPDGYLTVNQVHGKTNGQHVHAHPDEHGRFLRLILVLKRRVYIRLSVNTTSISEDGYLLHSNAYLSIRKVLQFLVTEMIRFSREFSLIIRNQVIRRPPRRGDWKFLFIYISREQQRGSNRTENGRERYGVEILRESQLIALFYNLRVDSRG